MFKNVLALKLVTYIVCLAWVLSFVVSWTPVVTMLVFGTIPLLMWRFNFIPNKIAEAKAQVEFMEILLNEKIEEFKNKRKSKE